MTRAEAIGLLVEKDLLELSESERASIVLDWWTIDADEPEFLHVPEDLRREMATRGEPEAVGTRYDPLLRIALRHRYVGVLNSYLETLRLSHPFGSRMGRLSGLLLGGRHRGCGSSQRREPPDPSRSTRQFPKVRSVR